uniref:Carbonic anhydrase n=1 Tax=Aegilops tauschii TaxID=37682 RepID=M8C8C8_AEGTA
MAPQSPPARLPVPPPRAAPLRRRPRPEPRHRVGECDSPVSPFPGLPRFRFADSWLFLGVRQIGDSTARGVTLRAAGSGRSDFSCATKASEDHSGLTRQLLDFQHDTVDETDGGYDPFSQLKERFTDFKQRNYVENFTNYQKLAEQQTPEFMVVACADSRVCPTSILGLQPGDAFTVRNVANLVPPYEVPNVLVVGHSRCGGIQALMSMKSKKDDRSSRTFIRDWVSLGKSARLSTEAAAGNLSFESQCRHCEKESINSSLLNLLTYPWIEERVKEGNLNLHGGYYNFIDCTFEKWTLVYRPGLEGGSKYAIKNRSTWS